MRREKGVSVSLNHIELTFVLRRLGFNRGFPLVQRLTAAQHRWYEKYFPGSTALVDHVDYFSAKPKRKRKR